MPSVATMEVDRRFIGFTQTGFIRSARKVASLLAGRPPPLSRSDDQAFHWRRCFGARKDVATQKSGRSAQQVDCNAFDDCTHIGRRREVASVPQLVLSETRPVGDNPTAAYGSSRQEHDRARAVIGALGAVDPGGS